MPDDDASDSLDVPERYDAESYRAGYAAAMRQIGQAALAGADGLAPVGDADAGTSVDGRGSDDDSCEECGADTLASMGAPAGSSPEGRVCPRCEL